MKNWKTEKEMHFKKLDFFRDRCGQLEQKCLQLKYQKHKEVEGTRYFWRNMCMGVHELEKLWPMHTNRIKSSYCTVNFLACQNV